MPRDDLFSITKYNPFLNPAGKFSEGVYFPTDGEVCSALEGSVSLGWNPLYVQPEDFSRDSATRYLFGNIAEEYGRFLGKNINHLSIHPLLRKRKAPIIHQIFFDNGEVDCGKYFDSSERYQSNVLGVN